MINAFFGQDIQWSAKLTLTTRNISVDSSYKNLFFMFIEKVSPSSLSKVCFGVNRFLSIEFVSRWRCFILARWAQEIIITEACLFFFTSIQIAIECAVCLLFHRKVSLNLLNTIEIMNDVCVFASHHPMGHWMNCHFESRTRAIPQRNKKKKKRNKNQRKPKSRRLSV